MIYLLMFIIGSILGSFYLCIGTRLPKNENIFNSRSKCDYCNKTLKWYNLIPIFSFIIQKGKCSYCGKKLSIEYILVEIATGLLFVFTYYYLPSGYFFYAGIVVVSVLMLIIITDFKYMIILDSPLVIGSILIIILKLIYYDFKTAIIGILSGLLLFLTMLFISWIGKLLLKKESLGGGDIKLAFFMGLALGFPLGLIALVLSTFLAFPYAIATLHLNANHEFPYGPFLAGALFIVFFTYDKFDLLLTFITS